MIDFRYIWAIIFGIFMLLLIITYCFDVVIRACTLFLYQIIAPVPIIAYISPNKKETDMLGNWAKKVIGCWASLFVRLAVLDFVIYFAQIILSEFDNNDSGLVVQLFILFGLLMFAKKMPKLIEEVIPGLKFEGFQLNPLKRISQDALGGNLVLGAGAAMAGASLSGATNFAQRAFHREYDENGNPINFANFRDRNGRRGFSVGSVLGGLGKTAGSTMAGAARGGTNAFNRTRKGGNIIGGAWNGYQTSMFSKLQREDNLRKAGLENAGLADRLAFGAGSVGADLARYAGVLNRGQQEYLDADRQDKEISNAQADLDRRKLELNKEKRGRLEPLQQYSNYAQKIKDRISNDKTVKDAQKELEDAQASGDETAIRNARARLEMFEKTAGNRLMNTDSEVRYYVEQMNRLQLEVQQRQNITLESARKADGTFNALSIYDTQHQANVISDQYSIREKAFEADQDRINAMKQTPEYITAHDQNSQAKLQNASRTNKDIQQPGFKPSSGPIQERFTDSSLYSGRPPIPGANRGGHGGPGGPGGPAPGGPGGPQP